MTSTKIVTGYVPIANHPKTGTYYGPLGERLAGLNTRIQPYYQQVEDTWLWKFIHKLPFHVTHPEADNPLKNTLDYMCVQHEKFKWLLDASLSDEGTDVFVWLDYGLFGNPLVAREPVVEYLSRIKRGTAIPGCWAKFDERVKHPNDDQPNWRFCGTVMAVDRRDIPMLYNAVALMAAQQIMKRHKATWEVNTLSRVDLQDVIPIRWYKADHGSDMFTEY